VTFSAPSTSHENSEDCGAMILGMQEERPPNYHTNLWIDDAIYLDPNQKLLRQTNIVVVSFGEKFKPPVERRL